MLVDSKIHSHYQINYHTKIKGNIIKNILLNFQVYLSSSTYILSIKILINKVLLKILFMQKE